MVWAWCFPEDSKGRLEAIFFNIVVKRKRQLDSGDFYFFSIGALPPRIFYHDAKHESHQLIDAYCG